MTALRCNESLPFHRCIIAHTGKGLGQKHIDTGDSRTKMSRTHYCCEYIAKT